MDKSNTLTTTCNTKEMKVTMTMGNMEKMDHMNIKTLAQQRVQKELRTFMNSWMPTARKWMVANTCVSSVLKSLSMPEE